MNISIDQLKQDAVELLKKMIATPSLSGQEEGTAQLLFDFLQDHGILAQRVKNNVFAYSTNHAEGAPLVLLNSHHDTVKPSRSWATDPFTPLVEGDKLTGLGSNDAGASVVSMLASFVYLSNLPKLNYRLLVAITAEEENSGDDGVKLVLPQFGKIDLGLVGEPTGMHLAVAEKGLIVLDCEAKGVSGHAARNEGVNALYIALEDIEWLRNYKFDRISDMLGPVKLTVTQIEAGTQHNVIPDRCRYVVDIRTNELYRNDDVLEMIKQNIKAEVSTRSYHLGSSRIDLEHPIVKRGIEIGRTCYGSPTLSDQSAMDFTTLKIGPGDSSRSHTAGEYIMISEIHEGIEIYVKMLADLDITTTIA